MNSPDRSSSRHLSAVTSPSSQGRVWPNQISAPPTVTDGPSESMAGSSSGVVSSGDSRTETRRKLDLLVMNEKGKGRAVDEQTSEEEEEEVDELISDDGKQAATSAHVIQPSLARLNMTDQSQGKVDLIDPVASASKSAPEDRGTVTSPSLAKILHPTNIEPRKRAKISPPPLSNVPIASAPIFQRATSLSPPPSATHPRLLPPVQLEPELLSSYACPICFSSPTNATLTPCGHICCGSCLFAAVKTTMQRTALMTAEQAVARCPVCRAPIPGWDGRGGGVIGLKVRTVLSL